MLPLETRPKALVELVLDQPATIDLNQLDLALGVQALGFFALRLYEVGCIPAVELDEGESAGPILRFGHQPREIGEVFEEIETRGFESELVVQMQVAFGPLGMFLRACAYLADPGLPLFSELTVHPGDASLLDGLAQYVQWLLELRGIESEDPLEDTLTALCVEDESFAGTELALIGTQARRDLGHMGPPRPRRRSRDSADAPVFLLN